MRVILLSFMLIFGSLTYAQNIKRIIDKNDTKGLVRYIEGSNVLDELISVQDYLNVSYSVHPIVYAAGAERIELVKLFVENKTKITDFDVQISLAFAISCSRKNKELTDYLYTLNPNLNEICKSCHGHNALMIAAVYGDEDLFFRLKNKSEFNLISTDINNLYHLIGEDSENFNENIFNEIKKHKDVNVNLINKYGRTPLHYAARGGNEILFFELLKIGAKPNGLDEFYADAIFGGSLKIYNSVKALFKTDPNWVTTPEMIFPNEDTYYPLEHAIKNSSTIIAKVIFKDMFNDVINLEEDNQIEVLVKVLNSRQLENDKFWPLWEVIQWENKELFEFLVRGMIEFNELELPYTAYNEFINGDYTENAEVLFTKFEYRSAKRRFGKNYVKGLYDELNVKF